MRELSTSEQRNSPTSTRASCPNAGHVDTCGVHFPRRMSLAYAFEHPAASAISDGFRVSVPLGSHSAVRQ
jgi:hypothetical protein